MELNVPEPISQELRQLLSNLILGDNDIRAACVAFLLLSVLLSRPTLSPYPCPWSISIFAVPDRLPR